MRLDRSAVCHDGIVIEQWSDGVYLEVWIVRGQEKELLLSTYNDADGMQQADAVYNARVYG